jgi:carboxymethylenebutenolidase
LPVVALMLAVGVAGALAARPTGPPRADIEMVEIGPTLGGTQAFVAWPVPRGKAPGVVLVHEAAGLNGQIRDVARRLSREGYVVIVPDLYRGKLPTDAEKAEQLSRALDTGRAVEDLRAAAAWLRSRPETAKSRLASMGFGMGGALALELALTGGDVHAVVMYYGRPVTDDARLERLAAPVQAHFGADDEDVPQWNADRFRDALARTGKTGEVFVYPGAGHAFMNENRPSYRPDATRQAWARTLAFLQKQLKS